MSSLKELVESSKPRERFKNNGVESLSDEELISILIRCGTKNKSVKEVSNALLKKIPIEELMHVHYKTLKEIKGIGEVKAITLLTAIEFGKRVWRKKDLTHQIRTSDDAYYFVKDVMECQLQEKFMVLFLDNRKFVIDKKVLFMGTVNQSNVFIRDVFREAVKLNAVSLILIHNHPSGVIKPSYQDAFLTSQFIKGGRLLNEEVLDHLIIGHGEYYSFRERNGDLFANDA